MYKLTETAANDIENILSHSITEFGLQQAENYYANLSRCLTLLGENPAIGVDASDIRRGYRRFPHQSHVIFYIQDNTDILVIRTLHQQMDAVRNIHNNL